MLVPVWQAENSISEALGAVIGGDIILLNSGFGIIIIYSILVLGKFHPVLSRSAVAFAGVASVGLSIGYPPNKSSASCQ